MLGKGWMFHNTVFMKLHRGGNNRWLFGMSALSKAFSNIQRFLWNKEKIHSRSCLSAEIRKAECSFLNIRDGSVTLRKFIFTSMLQRAPLYCATTVPVTSASK